MPVGTVTPPDGGTPGGSGEIPTILNDLSDVVISSGASGRILMSNGADWIDAAPAAVKSALGVVTATASAEGLVELATTGEATTGTDTTRAVTPAGLKAAIDALIGGAPGALDTLNEIAAALGNDANFAAAFTASLANKQPLHAQLTALAALASAADKMPYSTGTNAWSLTDLSTFSRSLLDDISAVAWKTSLGVGTAALTTATPSGNLAGTTVEAQLTELDAEKIAVSVLTTNGNLLGRTGGFPAEITPASLAANAAFTGAFAALGSGGLVFPGWKAGVYLTGTSIIAVKADGTVIASGTSSASVNATVINAALTYCAGTYTPGTLSAEGYGGGGTCVFGPGLYSLSSALIVGYGTNLWSFGAQLDRNGLVASAHSFQGAIFAPTSAMASKNVENGGGTTTRTPVIQMGVLTTGASTQSTVNPHGTRIEGIGIDMRQKTTCQGVLILDTQFVTIEKCCIGNARGTGGAAVEIISTIAPDDGAHGNDISSNMFVNCEKGIKANGTGATDSIALRNRILQMTKVSIEIGASGNPGGWQIGFSHFTTGKDDQSGTDEAHLYLSGAPCEVVGNYLDTTGGWSVFSDSGLMDVAGNYIKCAASTVMRPAPIYLKGNGMKSSITGNTAQGQNGTLALVRVEDASSTEFRTVVTGNVLGDKGFTTITGIVIDGASANAAVAESISEQTVSATARILQGAATHATMIVARGTANPWIFGNRIVTSDA